MRYGSNKCITTRAGCGSVDCCESVSSNVSAPVSTVHVPISAVSEGECLDSPLDRLFGHILLANESFQETKHRFIYFQISPWNVVGLELGQQNIQKHPDLVNALGCRGGSVAHMKHPKNQISGHYPGKEWDLGSPRCFPVVLNCGYTDHSHVDNDGQKSHKVSNSDKDPLQQTTSPFEFVLSPQLLDLCCCIPVG